MKLTNEMWKNGIYVKDMNTAEMLGKTIDEVEWEFTTNCYVEDIPDDDGGSYGTMIMACGECLCEPIYGVTWKL